jgi:hypothetical protein
MKWMFFLPSASAGSPRAKAKAGYNTIKSLRIVLMLALAAPPALAQEQANSAIPAITITGTIGGRPVADL